jgi:hypothetical protein
VVASTIPLICLIAIGSFWAINQSGAYALCR